MANSDDDTVTRLDPPGDRAVQTIHVGTHPVGVAAADGQLWVANGFDDTVTRIDTRRHAVAATIPVGPAPMALRSMAVGAGAVWVTVQDALVRIDPRTDRIAARILVHSPAGTAVGDGSVWVSNADDDTLTRIDARSNRVVARVGVGLAPTSVAVAAGFVWVVNSGEDTVSQIDVSDNRVVARIPAGAHAYDLTAGDGAVWMQSYGDSTVYRIQPSPPTSRRARSPSRARRLEDLGLGRRALGPRRPPAVRGHRPVVEPGEQRAGDQHLARPGGVRDPRSATLTSTRSVNRIASSRSPCPRPCASDTDCDTCSAPNPELLERARGLAGQQREARAEQLRGRASAH